MSKLKQQVINRIKSEGLEPTSRFYFLSHKYFFWLLFLISVFIGAIAFSSILFELVVETATTDLAFVDRSSLAVQSIPLFWVGLLILFAISAWFNYKRIHGTHRSEHAFVLLSSVLLSLLIGFGIFNFGFAQYIQDNMRESVPLYRSAVEKNQCYMAIFYSYII